MKKQINGVAPLTVLIGHDAERSEVAVPEAMKDAIRPDPEVVVRAQRRQFTAEYKKRILAEVDSAHEPGAIGALLRREGLYSSHLTHWRQQRDLGLAQHRRGPKPKHDPLSEEVRKLRQQNDRLTQRLARAELIIDVQKKVSSLLGISLATVDNDEDSL